MVPIDRPAAARLALTLLAAGFLWRLALALFLVPAWESAAGVGSTPDAYPLLARSIVEDGTLGYGEAGASPTTVRGPGFPLWLAPAVLVGGTDPRWMGVWGAIPGLLVGSLVGWLAALRHGRAAGWVAGGVALLHPLPSVISARAMGDDFYAALGAAGAIAWWTALRPGRSPWRWTAVSGALLAAVVLTRSSGLLVVAACVAFAVTLRGPGRAGPQAAPVLALVVLALAPAVVWSVRTSRLEGRPVFVHSLLFYNFWIGEGMDRYGPGDAPGGAWGRIVQETYARGGFATGETPQWYGTLEPREAARLEMALAAEALERIRTDPVGYSLRVAKGIGRFWFQAGTARRSAQYLAAVLPVLVLALVGSAVVLRTRDDLGRLFLLVLLLHDAAYAAVLPAARMSVQVYPELGYLAGAGAAIFAGIAAARFNRRYRR